MDWLKTLFGADGGVSGVVKEVADSVAQFVDTPEKKAAFEMAKRQADLEVQKLAFQADQAYLADRQSAREMYSKDNSLQKLFALTFLAAYILLTGFLLWIVAGWMGMAEKPVSMPEWAQALVSAIWGQMSAKVGTITDFLFGSSQGSRDKDLAVTQPMSKVPSS